MARKRDPNRDKAFEIYKEHDGNITNREIANMLGINEKTIGSWKSKAKDNWDAKLNGVLQTNERSTPNKKRSTTKPKKEVVESVEVVELESDEFTDKQRLFCLYFVKYLNATKAYKKVYECSYNTARTEGSRLLAKPNISSRVRALKAEMMNDTFLEAKDVLQKLMDIAFADITDFVSFGKREVLERDYEGNILKDSEGKPSTILESFVMLEESQEVDGSLITEIKQGKDGTSIKLADKMKALDTLAKYTDLLNEKQLRKLQAEQARLNVNKTKIEIDSLRDDKTSTSKVTIIDDIPEV